LPVGCTLMSHRDVMSCFHIVFPKCLRPFLFIKSGAIIFPNTDGGCHNTDSGCHNTVSGCHNTVSGCHNTVGGCHNTVSGYHNRSVAATIRTVAATITCAVGIKNVSYLTIHFVTFHKSWFESRQTQDISVFLSASGPAFGVHPGCCATVLAAFCTGVK